MNKNSFINQFSENIKFHYTSFDRVIIRGYTLNFFSVACVVRFLKAMGFSRQTNGVMRIFTDQLNAHISKQAKKFGAHIHWWPSMGGGVNGAKLKFVEEQYACRFNAFTQVSDPEALNQIAQEIDGKLVQERINFWMNRFFKFDKGKYST